MQVILKINELSSCLFCSYTTFTPPKLLSRSFAYCICCIQALSRRNGVLKLNKTVIMYFIHKWNKCWAYRQYHSNLKITKLLHHYQFFTAFRALPPTRWRPFCFLAITSGKVAEKNGTKNFCNLHVETNLPRWRSW